MDAISQFFHTLFSSDGLHQIITNGGVPVLCLIIFAETGLLIGFFLPGDTLLISAGLLSATGVIAIDIVSLNLLLVASAVIGNSVGYFIGAKAGKKLFERPNSRYFNREHLIKTHNFYEKYGGITMILARFVPIVRTFAPVVAGTAEMSLKRFTLFNIIGAVLWIGVTTSIGYFLARTFPEIEKYLQLAVVGVVILSLLLPIIQWLRTRKSHSTN
ncbi:MAG: VTT domain-containing protein [Bacteroidota bacterium]|nr:VTT domain-containing protein [Bacteroidota bacterium]MDP4229917.1 VTT domain-containing protein [Bacteroidota bacterium]MDP4235587.1 VTT domain-containing protein [Bacteroidota bacterium]